MITGGGTGGHIYPALAIAEEITKTYPESKILYVGNLDGMEHNLAVHAGFDFSGITVAGLGSRNIFSVIDTLLKNAKGVSEAKKLIKDFKPDLVVGTGGYACGPLMLAATKLGVPTLLHEQNAVMGKTNSILSTKVDKICLTFDVKNLKDGAKKKTAMTGLPVRDEILAASKFAGVKTLDLDMDKLVVLITGGSQGARTLNNAVSDCWQDLLAQGVQIIHIAGEKLYDECSKKAEELGLMENGVGEKGFMLVPYFHNMEDALGAADVVVARAGASFLAEVMALGKASVLVPYPFAAGNHQYFNAKALVDKQAAFMIEDDKLDGKNLAKSLQMLLDDVKLRENMAANAGALGRKDAAKAILVEAAKVMK